MRLALNFNDLKTAFAKERHAELMIGSGGAIMIAAMSSVLDPETLKLFDASGPLPSQLPKLLLWGTAILGGAYLIYKGLNRIDAERKASKTQNNAIVPVTTPSGTTSPLAIQIQHGHTLISINIQPEKNDAQ